MSNENDDLKNSIEGSLKEILKQHDLNWDFTVERVNGLTKEQIDNPAKRQKNQILMYDSLYRYNSSFASYGYKVTFTNAPPPRGPIPPSFELYPAEKIAKREVVLTDIGLQLYLNQGLFLVSVAYPQ